MKDYIDALNAIRANHLPRTQIDATSRESAMWKEHHWLDRLGNPFSDIVRIGQIPSDH